MLVNGGAESTAWNDWYGRGEAVTLRLSTNVNSEVAENPALRCVQQHTDRLVFGTYPLILKFSRRRAHDESKKCAARYLLWRGFNADACGMHVERQRARRCTSAAKSNDDGHERQASIDARADPVRDACPVESQHSVLEVSGVRKINHHHARRFAALPGR